MNWLFLEAALPGRFEKWLQTKKATNKTKKGSVTNGTYLMVSAYI
jgi:hypothetical protein